MSIFAYDSKQYKDQDSDKSFAKTLEQYPMRFSFQDGTIETVCPLEKESAWAVNIKKGILSAFQNSMDSFETSYSGLEVSRLLFIFYWSEIDVLNLFPQIILLLCYIYMLTI